ncbi:hypothetical protein R1flu_025459 [Riccia fluitans]|uniref:CBM20 domain-containing protein n=1 Tax=Riccia fluitans TaxID=41844 RepID=A0ABD1XY01_9MARC
MALSRPLYHNLANLISLISLSNGGEGRRLCNRNVSVNIQSLNPKQRHNAGRLWAVSRTARTSRVRVTNGSEASEKIGSNGGSKTADGNEDTENYKEQKQKVSVSASSIEVNREDVNLEDEGKRRRRRRRTKAEIEADAKVLTVEDFVRELEAIGESFETEKLAGDGFEESSRISGDNGAVKPKRKRKPRAKKVQKADSCLPNSNGRLPASDDSDLVRTETNAKEGSDYGSCAPTDHQEVEVKSKKESGITSSGEQKPPVRKKRPGRRERGVLAQEAAKSGKLLPSSSIASKRSSSGDVRPSSSDDRLAPSASETIADGSEGSNDDSASVLPANVEASVDVAFTVEDPADVPLTTDSVKPIYLDTLISIPDTAGEQNETDPNVEDNAAVPDVVSAQGSSAEEILEEAVIPVRKSGGKRRRQRRKKASLESVLADTDGGASPPVESEASSDGGFPFQNDVLGPITWCLVQFKVQADLEANQRLYVVGANAELGAWDLSLALPLIKSEDQDSENLWENTIEVPQGMMLEYKYFVEGIRAVDPSVDRRFGPEIQYFIPKIEGQDTSIEVIKDLWRPELPVKLHSLSWGSRWWEQIELPDPAAEVETDAERQEEEMDSGSMTSIPTVSMVEDGEDVALSTAGEKSVSGNEKVKGTDEWLKRKIRKKVLPREEPWLMESMIIAQRNERKKAEEKEVAKAEAAEAADIDKNLPPVQVEILINSPPCTMQRMAILEDGKVVELLLEPVNTRVQVGNVYLGVVRQLLPGMSGVFVDIGGFQLALLDITKNQYPYTYPNLSTSATSNASAPVIVNQDAIFKGDIVDDENSSSADDGDCTLDEESSDDDEEVDELAEDVRDEIDSDMDYTDDESISAEEVNEIANVQSVSTHGPGPITVNFGRKLKKWRKLEEGMQIIVQVKKEALGKKGPRLTAFPSLAGRFWVLVPRGRTVGVSRRITGPERRRLRSLAMELQPQNFALTVRTEALGHDREELERDLSRLLESWKEILDLAASSAVAAEHDPEGPSPVLLHRAMGQTLTIVRDFFNTKVHRMVIDSQQCFQEVTSYLQEVAPNLCDRVELYTRAQPIFDAFNVEAEIDKFSSKRVNLPNGGYLIVEETEALVSIDVNGGTGMLAQDISQGEAILEVNLAAARQIAVEIRLRDIGGIIVVDFIDMDDRSHHKLVYEEMRKATERDRSTLTLSEISEFGLMEMTRKRVRPSVTLTISEPCPHCHGVGRVEAQETTLSRIERAVRRMLAAKPVETDPKDSSKWPQFLLRVDPDMGEYLKARKRKRITQLSAALKVWLILKVAIEFHTGYFQVLEQRVPQERWGNGAGQNKGNAQNSGAVPPAGGLLSNRVFSGKRRRNFGNQVYNRVSVESNEPS